MDGRIHTSSEQSETNSFSFEIDSSNVEYFSLQGDTVHSQKRKKGQWDKGENSNLIGSQDTHLLNQYIQQMRVRPHEKLNAFHVVGNLAR